MQKENKGLIALITVLIIIFLVWLFDLKDKLQTFINPSKAATASNGGNGTNGSNGGKNIIITNSKVNNVNSSTSGDVRYFHNQEAAATEWVINHDLDSIGSVTVYDSEGKIVLANVQNVIDYYFDTELQQFRYRVMTTKIHFSKAEIGYVAFS
jgi:hypothetical protein